MKTNSRRMLSALLALSLSPLSGAAESPATATLDHLHCDSCEAWNQPQAPFQVFGNTWYVGTRELSALLVTSPEGHVLLDGALPQSASLIQANIEALGFDIDDVKLILNSHAHWDHAGGIAALQRASGAIVAASPSSAQVLRDGTVSADDPQYDAEAPVRQPTVVEVREIADGDAMVIGPIVLTAHATPGHTPGSTTWTWKSCERKRCLDIVYADSLTAVSMDGFRFSGGDGRRAREFAASIERVARLPCDIVVSTHPGFTDTMAKQAARTAQHNPFIDPQGCRSYAALAQERLDARLAKE